MISAVHSLTIVWKDCSCGNQITLLKTVISWQVALYGSISWTLKANDVDKLKAFEMTCYKRLLPISYHRTNESVR